MNSERVPARVCLKSRPISPRTRCRPLRSENTRVKSERSLPLGQVPSSKPIQIVRGSAHAVERRVVTSRLPEGLRRETVISVCGSGSPRVNSWGSKVFPRMRFLIKSRTFVRNDIWNAPLNSSREYRCAYDGMSSDGFAAERLLEQG